MFHALQWHKTGFVMYKVDPCLKNSSTGLPQSVTPRTARAALT